METEEVFYLCNNCAKDIYLKNYILKNGKKQKKPCTICQVNNFAIDIDENAKLNSFCRFLIRYHLPEYVYNSKWGGERFPEPFFIENDIISHDYKDFDLREESIEEFINCLFDLNKFPYHDLYYGSDEFGKNLFAYSIKNEGSFYWKKYKSDLKVKNHYLLKEDATNMFRIFFENYRDSVEIDSVFCRARIGYEEKIDESEIIPIYTKEPYKNDSISAPPIFISNAGRLNRHGVSYLYLASNTDVAIGEVRPHPGHYVSVGNFKNNTELSVIDLRFIDLFEYFDDEEKLKLFLFIKALSNELTQTVLPDNKEHYLITQFISDIIRDLKYDGIIFESSISDGYNLLVFDSSKFSYIEDSSVLLKIRGLTYEVDSVGYKIDDFVLNPIEKLTAYKDIYEK